MNDDFALLNQGYAHVVAVACDEPNVSTLTAVGIFCRCVRRICRVIEGGKQPILTLPAIRSETSVAVLPDDPCHRKMARPVCSKRGATIMVLTVRWILPAAIVACCMLQAAAQQPERLARPGAEQAVPLDEEGQSRAALKESIYNVYAAIGAAAANPNADANARGHRAGTRL